MNIPGFLVYCAIMAVTPGPNNLMSLYLGARGGWRGFWSFFGGSMTGLGVKCVLCGLLNVLLAERVPVLVPYLKWLGAAYMLYLAFCMVKSGVRSGEDEEKSGEGTFRSGVLLQVLNVKSWVAALSIFLPPPLSQFCPWRRRLPFSADWRACCGADAARSCSVCTDASACR